MCSVNVIHETALWVSTHGIMSLLENSGIVADIAVTKIEG